MDAVEQCLYNWATGSTVQATHYEGCDADHPRCAALTVLRRLAEMRERLCRQTGNSMDHPPTAGI